MEVKLIGNDDVDETDDEVKQLKLNNDRKNIYIQKRKLIGTQCENNISIY